MLGRRTTLSVVPFIMVLAVAACARPHGRPIDDWSLNDGRTPGGLAITFPFNPVAKLPAHAAAFSLHARIALTTEERGHDVTLVFGCYHEAVSVAVNGTELDDDGDTKLGDHRFVIPPALADAGVLDVVARTALDRYSVSTGFGVAPELEIGIDRRPWPVVTFLRYTVIFAFAFGVVLTVMFAFMYALDRRRLENAALAVASMSIIPFAGAWSGVLSVADPWVRVVLGLQLGASQIALLYYIHGVLDLGRPPRVAIAAACGLGLGEALAVFSFAIKAGLTFAKPLELLGMSVYVMWCLIRGAWRGARRHDARLLLAGGVVAAVLFAVEEIQNFIGRWYGGLHTVQLAMLVLYGTFALVLARQHVARERALEATTAALRHQVAARSRELSEALLQLHARPALALGRVVDGRYQIIRELGAGGMGAVYEAERLADHQRLALKTLRRDCEPAAMARFAREAQIAASIEHPNLVPVLDVGLSDGVLFLVMPLLREGSLAQQRARYGDAIWATPLLRQIAAGLAALHDRGIVHRDLKPANVLLDDGVARIADFGLASLGADDPADRDHALTRVGAMFGTPHYMAPELANGVREAAPASDVFAFGVLAYELLSGSSPFKEPPILARLGQRPIEPPRTDGLPEPLAALVLRCLDVAPKNRATAAELVSLLQRTPL
jgi:hypothetical protein